MCTYRGLGALRGERTNWANSCFLTVAYKTLIFCCYAEHYCLVPIRISRHAVPEWAWTVGDGEHESIFHVGESIHRIEKLIGHTSGYRHGDSENRRG